MARIVVQLRRPEARVEWDEEKKRWLVEGDSELERQINAVYHPRMITGYHPDRPLAAAEEMIEAHDGKIIQYEQRPPKPPPPGSVQ